MTSHVSTIRLFFLLLLTSACDYAKEADVQAVSLGVESVKATQTALQTDLQARFETVIRDQAEIRSNLALMGDGFNTLSESVVVQDGRVEELETTSSRLQREVKKLESRREKPRRLPTGSGQFIGWRLDLQTLNETVVHVRWCEADQGRLGFLRAADDGLEPLHQQCWTFGDTAVFRSTTERGPRVSCLRGLHPDEDGTLRAFDCYEPALYFLEPQ